MIAREGLIRWLQAHAAELAENDNPFASAEWLQHWLEQIPGADWRYLLVGSSGDPSMALHVDPADASRACALSNYYTSLVSPCLQETRLADGQRLRQEWAALRAVHRGLKTVDFAPVSEEAAALLASGLQGDGWMTRRYDTFGNWYLPCEGLAFDNFMAARPSQVINTWQRKAKKFRADGELRLQLVEGGAELERAIAAYGQVYSKSWKKPEPYPDFVPGWARICAKQGWLRLGLAWYGQTPIAAQFWLVRRRKAYIFKLAYDEEFSKYSAGTVLSAFMFKQALDADRVIEIDYLTGDDAYKQSWMSHRRQRFGLLANNPRSIQGLARGFKEWLGERRRKIVPAGTTIQA